MLPDGWNTAIDSTQLQKIQYCILPPAKFDCECFVRNVVTARSFAKFTLAKCRQQFFYDKGGAGNVMAARSACTKT